MSGFSFGSSSASSSSQASSPFSFGNSPSSTLPGFIECYSTDSQDGKNSPSPYHPLILAFTAILGPYVVQNQPGKISLSDEHSKIKLAFLVTLSMYGTGLIAEYKLQTGKSGYLSVIERFTLFIGILVVILLMIILFPELGLVTLIRWTLFLMQAIIELYQEKFQWILDIFSRTTKIVTNYFGRKENGLPVSSNISDT